MRYGLLCLLLVLGARLGHAQPTVADPESPRPSSRPALDAEPATETEARVQELLEGDGIYVVHFWAPWCHNSRAELGNGWLETIETNGDVTFIFVTVYNNGRVSEDVLARYSIPERVHRFAQPDHGPSTVHANRRQSFLGLPVSWTPTTWVFHRRGQLAFAMNYGEVNLSMMQSLLDHARRNWSH